ncbi:phage tail tape measure protein [Neisseria sp. S1]|uniref:phage tail tape measure protein n=1 Tax=Neisseria sp. S1 TaxID=3318354 RepID=UPI003A84892C
MAKDLVMRIILSAQDKASAALDKIRQSGNGMAAELVKNQKAVRDLERSLRDAGKWSDYQQKIKAADTELARLDNTIGKLSAEIKASGKPTREQMRQMEQLEKASQKTAAQKTKLADEAAALSRRLKAGGFDTRNFADAQAAAKAKIGQTTAEIARQTAALERQSKAQKQYARAQETTGKLKNVAVAATAAGMAVTGGVGVTVKSAMTEEDAMLDIVKQVGALKNADNSINHAEVAKMREEIRGLSSELPMTTVEIMQMIAAGARMDVPREQLADYVRVAAQSATAFDSADPQALAENLGRIQKNFKLSADEGRILADVINYLDDNAISSGENIINYMNRVSGSMGLAKISEKDVAALGSTLLTAGADESTAAGAVSSLFTRLSTAPEMKPVKDALAAIGMDARAVQKGMVEDAQTTVMSIIEAVKKMPKEEQAGLLKGLAGGEYNKVFAGLIANTEEWRRQIELANSEEAIGSMGREFETRMTAMSSKWQVFKNGLFNAGAGLGRGLFDVIGPALDKGVALINMFSRWQAANPALVGGIMKTAAVIGIGALAVGGLAAAVAAVLLPIAGMNLALVNAAAGISRVVGMIGMMKNGILILSRLLLMNPIGLAVTAAVAALVLLYIHWDKVKNALSVGWQWLKSVFKDNPLIAAFTGPIGVIGGLIANFEKLQKAAMSAWSTLKRVTGFGGSMPAAGKGYSSGGYTGAGGVNEPAGTVHRGEVVFSQRDVRRFGGWQFVERLRRGGLDMLRRGVDFMLPRNTAPAPFALAGAVPVRAAAGAAVGGGGNNYYITVNVPAGSNGEGIGRAIASELERHAAAAARRNRGLMQDKD